MLSPHEIQKNPHNPRLIFDEDSMITLKESIRKNGILVSLLVYKRSKDGKFVLVDGERRWRCALELGLKEVPVAVIPEPTTLENILKMFNIHHVREQWDLTPTALKMEVVMRLLKTDSDKELATATGLSQPDIVRCKALLTYPREYLDMTLVGEKSERISGRFFAELHPALELMRELPEIRSKYTKGRIIDRMLEKYRAKEIRGVLEFRDLTKLVRSIDKGAPRKEVVEVVESILEKPGVGIRDSFKSTAKMVYDVEKIYKTCKSLARSISKLEPSQVKGKSSFVEGLTYLRDTINKLLHSVK